MLKEKGLLLLVELGLCGCISCGILLPLEGSSSDIHLGTSSVRSFP
jgi:hypothetical protein